MRLSRIVAIVCSYIILFVSATNSSIEAATDEQPSERSVNSRDVSMNRDSICVAGACPATPIPSSLLPSPSVSPVADLTAPMTSASSGWSRILHLVRAHGAGSSARSESINTATSSLPRFNPLGSFINNVGPREGIIQNSRLRSKIPDVASAVSQGKSRLHGLNNTLHSVQTALGLGNSSRVSAPGQLSSATRNVPPLQAGASAAHSWANSTAGSAPSATAAAAPAAGSSGPAQTSSAPSGSTQIDTHKSPHLPRIPRTAPWVNNATYGYGSGTSDLRTEAEFVTVTLKRRNIVASPMPLQPVPSGCNDAVPYSFELSVIDAATGASDCPFHLRASGFILSNGILRSRENNVGYIASNGRFSFGNLFRPHTALDARFSVCRNASLAFGGSTVFYKCFGDGSFGIFNQPRGILCSPVFIGVVGTPVSSTSVGLATVTKVAIPVGSEAAFPGLGPSETLDDAGATTPTPTVLVEFDLDASEDAILIERSRKPPLRHHLAIIGEKPNRVCKTGHNNKHHRCRFRGSKDNACNDRKCKFWHGAANSLAAPSSHTAENATSI